MTGPRPTLLPDGELAVATHELTKRDFGMTGVVLAARRHRDG